MLAKRARRRLVSILVIVALLWTQLVVAAHGLCAQHVPTGDCMAAAVTPQQMDAGAATDDADGMMDAGCAAHCSQGGASSDVSRIPPLPAVLPMAFGWADLYRVIAIESDGAIPPGDLSAGPGGPTGHPAGVLLI